MRPARALANVVGLILLAGVATGCAADRVPAPTVPTSTPDAGAPVETPAQASEGGEPESPEDPTCEAIISSTLAEDLTELGWTYRESEFQLGDVPLPGSLQCMWGDFDGPATDLVQIYGVSPVDADTAEAGIASLTDQGWREEEDDGVLYVTEHEDTVASGDAEGYGMTYAFTDGWVKLADTKESLLLIEWPKS